MAGIEDFARGSELALRLGHESAPGEPGELPPERPRLGADLAGLVDLPGGGPPDLAARRLSHALRRRQHDLVRSPVEQVGAELLDLALQACPHGLVLLPGLRQHDDPLGARLGIGAAEDGDATLADAIDVADGFLHFVGINVAAGPDDDVLGPPGDEDIAAGDVGHVAAVDPFIIEQLSRLLFVLEISLGGGAALKLQSALPPLRHLAAGRIDDPDLAAGKRLAAGDDLERAGVGLVHGHRIAPTAERVTADAVDDRHAAWRRKSQADRVLGQPGRPGPGPPHGSHRARIAR